MEFKLKQKERFLITFSGIVGAIASDLYTQLTENIGSISASQPALKGVFGLAKLFLFFIALFLATYLYSFIAYIAIRPIFKNDEKSEEESF